MALHRREGSQNMLRGVLAFFWIALAGVSGVYLYSALANPAALDGQLANPLPVGSGDMTSAVNGSSARDQELAEIKASLRQLTQQMAAISTKLNLDPGALTSADDSADAEAAAEPEAPATPSSKAEEPEVATAPAPPPPPAPPVEQAKPAEAPKPAPQPEAKPVEQAAVDVKPTPPEIKPAPKPYEPPAVAVAPIDDLPVEEESETSSDVPTAEPTPTPAANPSAPEPSTPAPTESAALDPVALPPAANDGSTRYGIEIGVVVKQDGLRPLWREFLTKHAALVAGLQPRRVLAPDKKWRLIAGPFSSAAEASQACTLFKKASQPCEATVYAGDSL